jgi:DNA-binding transcriptional MerR regulator
MGRVHPAARPVFSISAVARMLGVPVATIRTWEDRYRLVVPARSAGGHRLYRRDQIDQLRFVRAQMAEGLTAADAHRLLAERLDSASHYVPGEHLPPSGRGVPDDPSQVTVLLAERDPYSAEMQRHALTSEGFDVAVALSDAAARHCLHERRPALAVIELLISGGAGLGLCRAVRRQGAPVIAVSVLQWRDRAMEAGADLFLGKPLAPPRLLAAIRGVCATHLCMPADQAPVL